MKLLSNHDCNLISGGAGYYTEVLTAVQTYPDTSVIMASVLGTVTLGAIGSLAVGTSLGTLGGCSIGILLPVYIASTSKLMEDFLF